MVGSSNHADQKLHRNYSYNIISYVHVAFSSPKQTYMFTKMFLLETLMQNYVTPMCLKGFMLLVMQVNSGQKASSKVHDRGASKGNDFLQTTLQITIV